jgi:hypothetical protein
MGEVYDDDIALWSEQQGALLRRLARGEKVNGQVDWKNVAAEIETIGRNRRRACETHLIQAILQGLKVRAWPNSFAVPHWEAKARREREDAGNAYTASMRPRMNVRLLYQKALNEMPTTIAGELPQPVPETCPFTLDELLAPVQRPPLARQRTLRHRGQEA